MPYVGRKKSPAVSVPKKIEHQNINPGCGSTRIRIQSTRKTGSVSNIESNKNLGQCLQKSIKTNFEWRYNPDPTFFRIRIRISIAFFTATNFFFGNKKLPVLRQRRGVPYDIVDEEPACSPDGRIPAAPSHTSAPGTAHSAPV